VTWLVLAQRRASGYEERVTGLAEQDTEIRLDLWLVAAPRSWRETLKVFVDVAHELASAHDKGGLYQEVRIDHVVVGSDGRGRLRNLRSAITDLPKEGPGGVRTAAISVKQRIAEMHSTEEAAYLAPEQIRGWVADKRSNQFSYCVGLYRALYRQQPFDHDWAVSEGGQSNSRLLTPIGSISFDLIVQAFDRTSLIELARQILGGNIRPPPHDTDVPIWLDQIIRRGLQPDPDDRYASMDDLLDEVAVQFGGAKSRRLAPRWRRIRKGVLMGGLGVLALGILVVLVYLIP
jgi:eukaryotic-like serine/threonine-protein kinase